MYLGVDYYPEHWDKSMIDEDLDNILELNCNVIRIGEFAWHMMESTEGNFDFSYFDRVIEKAKQKGLKVNLIIKEYLEEEDNIVLIAKLIISTQK